MKDNLYEEYRKRIQERGRKGECTANLKCSEIPQEGKKQCATHLTIKTTQQSKKRKQAKVSKRQHVNLDIARQSPSNSQASAHTSSHDASEPYQKLIWVTFPDKNPLEHTATLAMDVFFDDLEILGHDLWLKEARSMHPFRNTVVSRGGDGYSIHQGLVTFLATKAKGKGRFLADAYTWDWLGQQPLGDRLYSSCTDENKKPLRSVLFLHWTTNEPINPTLDEVYSEARPLKDIHGESFRVYPNEQEARQERDKLGDIRALDAIAKSSPDEFSYRPKTCFGHCRCSLENEEQTVHKRTQSGCATHVYVREGGEQHQLTCHREAHVSEASSQKVKCMGKKPRKTRKPQVEGADLSAHWFHQEFIPSLPKCEFRVFVATEPSKKGIRGRIGKVIAIAKTTFDPETQALAVREFVETDLESPLERSHLVKFALFVFEALRARPDSMLVFESLEVGVRLDIGLAYIDTGNKKFFVNEITRWYGAHYFSHNICPEPKTQICKQFASSFDEYLNGSTSYIT